MKVNYNHVQNLVDNLEFKYNYVEDTTLTICTAISNGFIVAIGQSACVDKKEYNKEIGDKIAKERALKEATDEIWKLEGYLLKITGKTSDYFKGE